VSFVDAKDVVASRLTAPKAWDAAVDPRSGEHTSTDAVRLSVAQAGEGRAVVTMTPDQVWLTDPARVFPITIDPTYVSVDVTTSFDTYVSSMYPTAKYSTAAELRVFADEPGGHPELQHLRRVGAGARPANLSTTPRALDDITSLGVQCQPRHKLTAFVLGPVIRPQASEARWRVEAGEPAGLSQSWRPNTINLRHAGCHGRFQFELPTSLALRSPAIPQPARPA
jgi:hypothetical protein